MITNSTKDQRISHLEAEVDRLKSSVHELVVLIDLAVAASSSLEIDQVLDIIVDKAIKATKA